MTDEKQRCKPTFDVSGEGICQHEVGNENCKQGWCGGYNFPRKCKCGGLVHADFGDDDYDCEYWRYRKCDKCGDEFEEEE